MWKIEAGMDQGNPHIKGIRVTIFLCWVIPVYKYAFDSTIQKPKKKKNPQ
jgi:hypothetical protein